LHNNNISTNKNRTLFHKAFLSEESNFLRTLTTYIRVSIHIAFVYTLHGNMMQLHRMDGNYKICITLDDVVEKALWARREWLEILDNMLDLTVFVWFKDLCEQQSN
jgi:hypothetical protein